MNPSLTDMLLSAAHTTTDRANARAGAALTARAEWTGRSRVSSETNSVLARISTSGFHRTRVSALRHAAGGATGAWRFMSGAFPTQRINTCRPELELLLM